MKLTESELNDLKSKMDNANKVLQKDVRKAKVPSDFKNEEKIAKDAYRAYWSAVDSN